jgi:chorismate mutase-like protein
MDRLVALRSEIDRLNRDILERLQQRAEVVREIARYKREHGVVAYDPSREERMLRDLMRDLRGPLQAADVRAVFTAIFRASLHLQQREGAARLDRKAGGTVEPVRVGDVVLGAGEPAVFFGPVAIESAEQIGQLAGLAAQLEVPALLHGGAFKAWTRPEAFQGLREEGVHLLHQAGRDHSLPVVVEVLDIAALELVAEAADMIQVGAATCTTPSS